MSVSTFLSEISTPTSQGIFAGDTQFRILGGAGSYGSGANISRLFATTVATSPAGGATFTADCPNITTASQVVITQSYNWTTLASPVGTYSVSINPTGGTGGKGAFTLTSNNVADRGQSVVYWVDC
jgi:hypothetical protein